MAVRNAGRPEPVHVPWGPHRPLSRGPTAPRSRRSLGFTLVELLVVIAIIVVLMAILFPVLNRVREAGRRSACLGNLRQMQMAWHLYADDHNGYIVCGHVGTAPDTHEEDEIYTEQPWLMRRGPNGGLPLTASQVDAATRTGALAPYVGNVSVYRCPSRYRRDFFGGEQRGLHWISSYYIAVTMNCLPRRLISLWDTRIRFEYDLGRTVLFIKNISQLVDPGPASRMVFLDLGWGWGGNSYGLEQGWTSAGAKAQPPPIHHSNGTCMSFADGHSEYWKWQNPETIQYAEACIDWHWYNYVDGLAGAMRASPKFPGGIPANEDCLRLQRAIRGKGPVSVTQK